ncbi:MAG TPA: DUF433 domain-containing protein [Bryobacteraceae bacterium]|jgi:uncharacterized protein (DUF433 family)|nr:DUF433 domain-containing protein [Bryobacteraceae bacterium]
MSSARRRGLPFFDSHGHPSARLEWPDDPAGEKWSNYGHTEECSSSGKDFDLPLSSALKRALESFPSIAMDADVLSGAPRIAGTRIPVYMILDAIEYYGTVEGAIKSYSQLTVEQVKDALSFAAAVLEQPVDHEPSTSIG